jgi:ATP-dependent exoDNAse (exonuclease V) beta subunit
MIMAPDQAQRDKALDVERSVIVQAPAGSGKTTLLVQRYLRLLGRATRPEEILAITFTRKAAAEMRDRVLEALRRAAPEAEAALARDHEAAWHLTLQPNRLKIQTIDSFASGLVRQLPLAAEFRPGARLLEDAADCYKQAVDRLFQRLYRDDPLNDELASVLALFRNDYAATRALLTSMLAHRDQWLDLVRGVVQIGGHDPAAVRELVAAGVAHLTERTIAEVCGCLDESERCALEDGLAWAADNLGVSLTGPGDAYRLAGRLLVTGKGTLRRRLTRQHGFPASDPARKSGVVDLLERLGERGCAPLFDNLRVLPTDTVDHTTARQLTSLCITLLLAVNELDSVLRDQGAADFTQLVLAAARALADGDSPTELALVLDYRIRHLLVDEFQDTSEAQFRLFSRLVQGWSPGDGNTFFAVGDPMQSIYRFRDADVRVFFDAWHDGIAGVPLQGVRLTANFRAAAPLVGWYNRTFAGVMGPTDDPLLGRVAYRHAVAARANTPRGAGGGAVRHDLLPRGSDQAGAVVGRLQELLATDPGASIAVLVRSRAHLVPLLPALRRARIPWRATDIAPLAARPAVQDLVSLARAMADPGDRLAWFSVLRAPWVGLDHPDLEAFAASPCLADAVRSGRLADGLSSDGRRRLERFLGAWQRGMRLRHEASPRTVLESVWLMSGGAEAYADDGALRDAERLFALMDDLGADADDPGVLQRATQRLFAEDTGVSALSIMTIHKAKGLEFDHVILPFLDRATRPSDPPMLLWRREGGGLLMAGRQGHDLYDWLAREDRARDAHERERLLYVACTRARDSLHLFAEADDCPAPDSLLALMWPHLAEPARTVERQVADASPSCETDGAGVPSPAFRPPPRLRLPAGYSWQAPPLEYPPGLPSPAPTGEDGALGHLPEVALGTLMHEVLFHLSRGPLPLDADAWCRRRQVAWRDTLEELGVASRDHESVLAHLVRQVRTVLRDPEGRWILEAREGARAELALTCPGEDGVSHVFVDRTFVDSQGERWIVDYKTGAPSPEVARAAFVAAETARHAGQLRRYAMLAGAVFPEPICLALYFTALPHLQVLERLEPGGGFSTE